MPGPGRSGLVVGPFSADDPDSWWSHGGSGRGQCGALPLGPLTAADLAAADGILSSSQDG
jgi:hypothetical protein